MAYIPTDRAPKQGTQFEDGANIGLHLESTHVTTGSQYQAETDARQYAQSVLTPEAERVINEFEDMLQMSSNLTVTRNRATGKSQQTDYTLAS